MKKVVLTFLFLFAFLISEYAQDEASPPTLQVSFSGISFTKGDIDPEVVSELIALKQEELKTMIIKQEVYNLLGQESQFFNAYFTNLINTTLQETDLQVITQQLVELNVNAALVLAFAQMYMDKYQDIAFNDTSFSNIKKIRIVTVTKDNNLSHRRLFKNNSFVVEKVKAKKANKEKTKIILFKIDTTKKKKSFQKIDTTKTKFKILKTVILISSNTDTGEFILVKQKNKRQQDSIIKKSVEFYDLIIREFPLYKEFEFGNKNKTLKVIRFDTLRVIDMALATMLANDRLKKMGLMNPFRTLSLDNSLVNKEMDSLLNKIIDAWGFLNGIYETAETNYLIFVKPKKKQDTTSFDTSKISNILKQNVEILQNLQKLNDLYKAQLQQLKKISQNIDSAHTVYLKLGTKKVFVITDTIKDKLVDTIELQFKIDENAGTKHIYIKLSDTLKYTVKDTLILITNEKVVYLKDKKMIKIVDTAKIKELKEVLKNLEGNIRKRQKNLDTIIYHSMKIVKNNVKELIKNDPILSQVFIDYLIMLETLDTNIFKNKVKLFLETQKVINKLKSNKDLLVYTNIKLILCLVKWNKILEKQLRDSFPILANYDKYQFLQLLPLLYKLDDPETYYYFFNTLATYDFNFFNNKQQQLVKNTFKFVNDYTYIEKDTNDQKYLGFKVEDFIVNFEKSELNSNKNFGLLFSVGTNTASFFGRGFNYDTLSFGNFSYISEKIGVRCRIFNFDKYRYNHPLKRDREPRTNDLWNASSPIVSDIFVNLYSSGLLYNIVPTTTQKGFNFPMVSVGLGVSFYNSLLFTASLGTVVTPDMGLSKGLFDKIWQNTFINIGFDVRFGEYLDALNKKRKAAKYEKEAKK